MKKEDAQKMVCPIIYEAGDCCKTDKCMLWRKKRIKNGMGEIITFLDEGYCGLGGDDEK
ncbi:hypothetical protein KA005_06185 [bacterium]|nr:hypothetical protein [bacterium]